MLSHKHRKNDPPTLILHISTSHRGGRRSQGNASLTSTIHKRMSLVRQGRWDALAADLQAPTNKIQRRQQMTDKQTDVRDIQSIQQFLGEHEIQRALGVLDGPLQLAGDKQIQEELPPAFAKQCRPIPSPSQQLPPSPETREAVYQAICQGIKRAPRNARQAPPACTSLPLKREPSDLCCCDARLRLTSSGAAPPAAGPPPSQQHNSPARDSPRQVQRHRWVEGGGVRRPRCNGHRQR